LVGKVEAVELINSLKDESVLFVFPHYHQPAISVRCKVPPIWHDRKVGPSKVTTDMVDDPGWRLFLWALAISSTGWWL
jgi:hypothetical protein